MADIELSDIMYVFVGIVYLLIGLCVFVSWKFWK